MRQIIKEALLRLGVRVERVYPPDPDPVEEYFRQGCPEWSCGYCVYKDRMIERALADSALLAVFARGQTLPERYGWGLDERIVEYPWLLAHLPPEARSLFDGGSAMNHPYLVRHPSMQSKQLTIMTFSPETECYWRDGVSYLYGDLRNIPLRDGLFDAVVSISTLEHIGFDNTIFSPAGEVPVADEQAYREVLAEYHRLLKAQGRLLLSVPYGTTAEIATFQIFNKGKMEELHAAWPGRVLSEIYYRYDERGWAVASPAEGRICD